MAYSRDLKARVLADMMTNPASLREHAKKFGVPLATVGRWAQDPMVKGYRAAYEETYALATDSEALIEGMAWIFKMHPE